MVDSAGKKNRSIFLDEEFLVKLANISMRLGGDEIFFQTWQLTWKTYSSAQGAWETRIFHGLDWFHVDSI